jgi:hypothetical protein
VRFTAQQRFGAAVQVARRRHVQLPEPVGMRPHRRRGRRAALRRAAARLQRAADPAGDERRHLQRALGHPLAGQHPVPGRRRREVRARRRRQRDPRRRLRAARTQRRRPAARRRYAPDQRPRQHHRDPAQTSRGQFQFQSHFFSLI